MSIWRWAEHWEPVPESARLTLGEGDTPLVRSRRIGPEAGLNHLFFKLETTNPSGSYKDRFAAAAISHMIARKQSTCVATSSGNTGAALATYCAAGKIRCRIAVVETAPEAKLQQMLAYGADIFRVRGFGADAVVTEGVFEKLAALGHQAGHALQISAYAFSPLGMAGVESIAFELTEQTGTIDHVFCPAGGGGLTLALARGFAKAGRSAAVHCVQPEGNDTIAGPLRDGSEKARAVTCASQISGLQVASVIDGDDVIRECRPTRGNGHTVSDEAIWNCQRRLAREEGLFSEPAGAVALAGALQAAAAEELDPHEHIVCLVTGSGFKDIASVERMNASANVPVIDHAGIS